MKHSPDQKDLAQLRRLARKAGGVTELREWIDVAIATSAKRRGRPPGLKFAKSDFRLAKLANEVWLRGGAPTAHAAIQMVVQERSGESAYRHRAIVARVLDRFRPRSRSARADELDRFRRLEIEQPAALRARRAEARRHRAEADLQLAIDRSDLTTAAGRRAIAQAYRKMFAEK